MRQLKEQLIRLIRIHLYLFLKRVKSLCLKINIIEMSKIPSYYDPTSKQGDLSPQLIKEVPRFSPGDIVYLLYNPNKDIGPATPVIGSSYEIDCKVLSIDPLTVKPTTPNEDVTYQLMSGHGHRFKSTGKYLIPAKEYALYTGGPTITTSVDTELCPKNTVFLRSGDYFCNELHGIYIHVSRVDELIKNEVVKQN